MTELAYLSTIDDGYVRTFRARITALPPGGIVLDRTYFYPTGGGQPSDRGTVGAPGLDPVEVVDVTKSGASVVHRIRSDRGVGRHLTVGTEVEGTIDWERRHRHMRLHTGQHFLSARLFARAGRRTRKAALSGVRATLDLDGAVPDELWPEIARDLAAVVAKPEAVAIRHVSRNDWDRHPFSERSGLVPLPPQVDPVRVIEIGASDVCPCGGTHLRSTEELGAVLLERPTPLADGGVRVAFTLDGAPVAGRTG